MVRAGRIVYFEEEGTVAASVPRDRRDRLEGLPIRKTELSDGSVLAVLPHCEATLRFLWSLGLSEALAVSPLALDEASLPLVEGKYRPMRHQLMTAAFMALHPRCYVLSEPRLGKTGSVVLAMEWMRRNRKFAGGVLVITTYTTMRSVWMDSIAGSCPDAEIRHVHGKGREDALSEPADWYVANYDSVRISEKAFRDAVADGRIGAVVIDELTHVGNPSSRRSRAICRLCRMPELSRAVGLTGSPADNVEAVFGMGLAVNPRRLPCSTLTSWRNMTLYRWGSQPWQTKPSADAPRVINEALQPAVRYRKSDVFDLPPVTEQVRECEPTKQQRLALDALRADAMAVLASGETVTAANGGVLLTRALQIGCGSLEIDGETVRVDHAPRTRAVIETIEETPNKTVVFCPFVAGCETLAGEIAEAGHSVEVITGSVSGKRRDEILSAFQNSPDPRVLVCHPVTVGFGTELSAADTMIFYVPLLLGGFVYNQSLERLSSVKQKSSSIAIVHIVGSRVERDVLRRLREGHGFGQMVAGFFEAASKNSLTV